MKAFNTITCSALVVLMTASCAYLEEKSSTQLEESSVYETEAGLESLMYGCYCGLQGSSSPACSMQEYLQSASGLDHWKYATNTVNDENRICCLHFTQFSDSVLGYTCFTGFYSGIQRCNSLIERLPNSPVDGQFKKEIEAEARFVRALMYFYLVRLYGDIPLYDKTPATFEEGHSPRVPFWEIYNFILSDLTVAEVGMREWEQSPTQSGRCCKWAATALKASVYATIGSLLSSPEDNFWDTSKRVPDFSSVGITSAADAYVKALEAADKVIENGPFTLAEHYSDLFRWTGGDDWSLRERIIVIPNTPETSASFAALRSLPRYITSAEDGNKNYGRFRPSRFFFQKWGEAYGGAKGEGKSANIYVSSNDPRFDVTFFYNTYYDFQQGVDRQIYPSSSKVRLTTPNDKTMQAYYKKYYDPEYNSDSGHADFYVMRFAEMFLISAEACAFLSSSPGDAYWQKAFERIETIHRRARNTTSGEALQPRWDAGRFLSDDDSDPSTDPRQELMDGIFWERMYEMIGEGHEYYDTHRFGAKWLSRVIAQPKNIFLNLPEQADFVSGSTTYRGYTSYLCGIGFQYETDPQQLRKSLLCAFPHDEMVYNQSISEEDQNDFYWR